MILFLLMIKNKKPIENTQTLEFYRYYFVTFLIKNSINEDKITELIKKIFENLKTQCELIDVKTCGKKKLCYPIQKQLMANYGTGVIKFKEDENLKKNIDEMHRHIIGTHEVLRHLTHRTHWESDISDNLFIMKSYLDKNIDSSMKFNK